MIAIVMILGSITPSFEAASAGGLEIGVGDKAPELKLERVLQGPEAGELTLEKLKGQVVVLEFWATWCGPCIVAIPHLNELAKEYESKPLRFISVSDEQEAIVGTFLEKRPMNSWVALDLDRSLFDAFGVKGIPQTVLINREGVVAAMIHPSKLDSTMLAGVLAGKLFTRDENPLEGLPQDASRAATRDDALLKVQIARTPGDVRGSSNSVGKGRYHAKGYDIIELVSDAHGVSTFQIQDHSRLGETRFDVLIEVPPDHPAQVTPLLRGALQAAFNIQVKRVRREVDVHYLRKADAPPGPDLKLTASTGGSSMSISGGVVSAVGYPTSALAEFLQQRLTTPVFDETGLTERYDWELKLPGNDPAEVKRIVRERLGLDLIPGRAEVETLIIEPADTAPVEEKDPAASADENDSAASGAAEE